MLHKHDRLTKGLAAQIVHRHPPVVEVAVRNIFEMRRYEALYHVEVLADGQWTHLLVITDHDNFLSQIARNEGHHVALTRLVYDDDVEACSARIELFDNTGQRHDPYRNRVPTLTHEPDSLDP